MCREERPDGHPAKKTLIRFTRCTLVNDVLHQKLVGFQYLVC
jgi:hypothetical protein